MKARCYLKKKKQTVALPWEKWGGLPYDYKTD